MKQTYAVQKFLLGLFDDEAKVIQMVKTLHHAGVDIHDVYTPYAVHGLDDAMGIRRSRLPIVCFVAGVFGFLLALIFQSWVFTTNWPINFGGKPFFALPAFIPVTFEVTVLVGGLVTVAAFLLRSRLLPGTPLKILDSAITDHHFVVAIRHADASLNVTNLEKMFYEGGAAQVREGEVVS